MTIVDEFEDEEEFIIPVPEASEEDDEDTELVFPIVDEDEAHAILDKDL